MKNKKQYLYYLPLCLLVVLFIYIQVTADLALPGYLRDIINNGIVPKDMGIVAQISLQMIGVAVIGAVGTIFASLFAAIIAAGVAKNIRADVFEKVEGFSFAEFNKFSTASLIIRNTNDIQQVQMFIFMFLRMVVSAPIMAIGGIQKAIDTSGSISWILGVSIPASLVVISLLMIVLVPLYNKVQKYIDGVNKVSREQLNGIRVIRAFRNEKFEEDKFDTANTVLTRTNIMLNRIMVMLFPAIMLILNFMQLAIVWFGAKAISENSMMLGDIIAFINYAMQVMFSFIMLTMISVILPRAAVSWKRIRQVLKTESTIKNVENPLKDLADKQDFDIEFKNVSYSYPHATEKVLDNISFKANKGNITAIIGSTGSGKSTLINLIPRFFDVTEGEILINGKNVKEYDLEFLHNMMGYVPQKAVIFSGTIESNILLGKQDANKEEIIAATKIAQAEEFINDKEAGYESEIAQGGTNLSGGQKQRLSIARALIRKPAIYIFDDSFSALDFKTDKALREALSPYLKESIAFIVAQRVSTIINAQQIIVLDDGKIAGIGTHKELMSNCNVYKEIASSQLSEEELRNV